MTRREIELGDDGKRSSGVQVTVTRKGMEIFGWHDHFAGNGEPIVLSWKEIEEARRKVMEVRNEH